MIEVLEFLDEVRNLQVLYRTDELRDYDFNELISKYQQQVNIIDAQMDQLFVEMQEE